jgi:hypothetical protein
MNIIVYLFATIVLARTRVYNTKIVKKIRTTITTNAVNSKTSKRRQKIICYKCY